MVKAMYGSADVRCGRFNGADDKRFYIVLDDGDDDIAFGDTFEEALAAAQAVVVKAIEETREDLMAALDGVRPAPDSIV
jgi:hypothetical protein